MPDAVVTARLSTLRSLAGNITATARELGIGRATLQNTIRIGIERGLAPDLEIADPAVPLLADYVEARTRKIAAYQKKQRKGDWRKPVMIRLPDRPFRLKVFGDPHLDADGCDFELFEKHWLEMDAEAGVYGVCVGDWFNNWLRALAHLWKGEGDPSDAWLCLEYLMEQRGDALLAACSGNHDDWSHGPADPVDLLMKKHGVVYRKGAVRPMLAFAESAPIFLAIRHKWRGSSIYSPAHGIVRAGIWGWRDNLSIGGHIHTDDSRLLVHQDGFVQHVCQVSAFKVFDEFADVQGFQSPKISPVWDYVVNPRKPDTDPDKFKVFWSSEDAQGYLDWLRRS